MQFANHEHEDKTICLHPNVANCKFIIVFNGNQNVAPLLDKNYINTDKNCSFIIFTRENLIGLMPKIKIHSFQIFYC